MQCFHAKDFDSSKLLCFHGIGSIFLETWNNFLPSSFSEILMAAYLKRKNNNLKFLTKMLNQQTYKLVIGS